MSQTGLPPLAWLRAFEAAARCLSFTGAARELNMTQSAVSQHVKNLETFLGRPLFIRRTRALELTEDGFNYLPTVQEAFATLAAGTRALAGRDRGRRLTIQSNLGFSAFWLAPRIGALLAAHPWLVLDVVTAIWDPDRTARQAQVEIRFGRGLDQALGGLRLTRDTAYPVCSPALGAAADWRRDRLFDCRGSLATWEAWVAAQGARLAEDRPIQLGSSFTFSLNAAVGGAGLAMAHDTLAADALAAGTLVRPFAAAIPMPEAYYLIAPPAHAETPATRAFCAWLTAALGTAPA